MLSLDKSNHQVVLYRYLMSEDTVEIVLKLRINQQGKILGIGYLTQRASTRVYRKIGVGLGMLHRIQEYARAGRVKRTNGEKIEKLIYYKYPNIILISCLMSEVRSGAATHKKDRKI